MKPKTFQLYSASFVFDEIDGEQKVLFAGQGADSKNTHISLIAGANGTSKSRILASVIERLCEIKAEQTVPKSGRRSSASKANGITCTDIQTKSNGITSQSERDLKDGSFGEDYLPSRVLVLSNLVMDKFHFPRAEELDDPFYHYLGVRQATNLTTTGSAERATSLAVMELASDTKRLKSFQSWVDLAFGGGRALGLSFPRLKQSELNRFLLRKDKYDVVLKQLERRFGAGGRPTMMRADYIDPLVQRVVELFAFLADRIHMINSDARRPEMFLPLSVLSASDRVRFSGFVDNFSAASQIGFSAWPTLCIEANPWLPFNQLSSGEQNILSTGAKLVAYARPACLVAIDEPEISLNVVWQQRYIDLVLQSLSHASGSHVVIATHSPHLISNVPIGRASLLLIEKLVGQLKFQTLDAEFEGWGAEAILYQVLGIPSASSFELNRDLARVLRHIQNGGKDKALILQFLEKVSKLNYSGVKPLEMVVDEIGAYAKGLE